MVCIYCGGDTRIVNSRLQKQANQVWRRRKCTACGSICTTHESTGLESAIAVTGKQAGLQPFSRDTLFVSLYESCKHRSLAIQEASALTQTIISKLRVLMIDGVLDVRDIKKVTHQTLMQFDTAAGTMYRAYHPD